MGLRIFHRISGIKKEWKTAFISTFLLGLLIHIYKFTNTLPNHDSLFNYYSDQNVLGSGRWLLSLACGFSSWFDLPWITGLISLCFIALTVVIIVDTYDITNPVLICICGGLVTAFPGITETFFFGFTADGYMIAMFLAALSVWLVRLGHITAPKCVWSGVGICCCCGIYQAYVSFALVFALLYLALMLLENRYDAKQIRQWIVAQIAIYGAAMLSYYVIWKGIMWLDGSTANDYQGISSLSLSVETILQGIPNSIKSLMLLFLEWNVLEHHWTLYGVLNVIFLVLMILGVVAAVCKTGIWKKTGTLLLFLICLGAVPFAACIWYFASPDVGYRPMMLVSIVLVYIFAAVIYEKYAAARGKNFAAFLLAVMIFNNGLMANISYYYMNRTYYATFAAASEMMARIHDLDTDSKEITVIGNASYDVVLVNDATDARIPMLTNLLEKNLMYDDIHLVLFLNETFYCDYNLVGKNERIAAEAEVMPCWPDSDSIRVVDNVIVIKLAETEE